MLNKKAIIFHKKRSSGSFCGVSKQTKRTINSILCIKKAMERTLSEYLSEIPEFRRQNKNFAHPLLDILLLSICALFHGAKDFEEMADFGRAKEDFLRGFLSLPNGIPSHDTIRRVFL